MAGSQVARTGGSRWRGVSAVSALALISVASLTGAGQAGPPPGAMAPGGGRLATAGIVSTVAGGVGGPAGAAKVAVRACGVSYRAGHLYIAGMTTVRKVVQSSGRLTTPAGSGLASLLGDGGPAAQAGIDTCGVAVDRAGNLIIADYHFSRIRVVAARTGTFYGQAMTAGDIYTVAGDGDAGFAGDGGPATSAAFDYPEAVAAGGHGDLVIADPGNDRVREVSG